MAPLPSRAPTAAESRSERKHRQILEAATGLFLAHGYLGTSMDEVAARAGVSKQTVYKHFEGKEKLFEEIVTTTVDEAGDPVQEEVARLGESDDLEADLREIARRQLAVVVQPRIMQLRRLVIGEAERFPELGRAFYERGAGRSVTALAAAFEALAARGMLTIEDPTVAASHFNWLVMAHPVTRAMFLGDEGIPPRAELDRYADAGTRAFLAAYGG
jgi:TetR/AcrR family transcriptional repressor of mexJK operon